TSAMITEKITSKLTDVEFDIIKSLERLAQNQLPQGTASQQYVMTGANDLALMLSAALDNMQEMANPGSGQGQGQGKSGGSGNEKQLEDIIISQEELAKKIGEALQKGKSEKEGSEGEEKK